MRNFTGAIRESVLNFHAEKPCFYAAGAYIFYTALFLRRNTAPQWSSLPVSCRRVSFSSAEPALDREGRYLNAAATCRDSTEHVRFPTKHVRLSKEKRHISTQKLDFYAEHACFCEEVHFIYSASHRGHEMTSGPWNAQMHINVRWHTFTGVPTHD